MPTTSTLRVTEPREILALVPHRLGFRPRDSAVVVGLRPPRGKVGLVVRADLPRIADAEDGADRARSLVTLLDRDGASRLMLVLYTDVDPRGRPDHPAHRAAEHVRAAAEAVLDDVLVWVVAPTGYLALGCADPCCPPGGRPLRELESTLVGARLVVAGSSVADSRDDVARIRPATGERRAAVARVRRRWERRFEEALCAGDAALADWRQAAVAAWRTAVEAAEAGHVAGAAPWGRLEAGLADRRVRDAVLVALVPGTGDLAERSVEGVTTAPEADQALADAVAAIVDPAHAVEAPVVATRVHEDVLELVVALGQARAQAPALTLLALLAWWRGDGARASVLLDRALADEPGYRLALLLRTMLDAGLGPGWTRRAS